MDGAPLGVYWPSNARKFCLVEENGGPKKRAAWLAALSRINAHSSDSCKLGLRCCCRNATHFRQRCDYITVFESIVGTN